MQHIGVDKILCFPCVSPVQPLSLRGERCVRCKRCGHTETLEKAIDDCFVFTVASAITAGALRLYSAHACMFMPLTSADPRQIKESMIATGRVRLLRAG